MSNLPAERTNPELQAIRLTRAVLRYRDGRMVLIDVFREQPADLRRAGFQAYPLRFDHDDGKRVETDLWSQEKPRLADYLNAAMLLFDTEPGSLHWE